MVYNIQRLGVRTRCTARHSLRAAFLTAAAGRELSREQRDRALAARRPPGNSDGLRYSTVRITIDGTSYAVNEFSPDSTVDGEFTGQGCDAWGLCGSCWLDGAGHGKCVSVKLSAQHDLRVSRGLRGV